MRFLIFIAILFSVSAHSHPLDLGFIQMQSQGEAISVSLDLNPSLAASLIQHVVTEINPPLIESRYQEFFDKTLGSSPLLSVGAPCRWTDTHSELLASTVRLTSIAHCAKSKQLDWSFPFIHGPLMPATFQVLIRANLGGTERVYNADRQGESVHIAIEEADRGFQQFVRMGIAHIGALPSEWWGPNGFHIAYGIDHILFLLGLILSGGTLLQMIRTATGFTVGHSVTLALATLGLVRISPRIAESAIALSIAFVAAETLYLKTPRERWRIAAFFGLVHGFGFAAALSQLNLSGSGMAKALVGFNCGVEIAQVIIVAILAPVLNYMRKSAPLRRYLFPAIAIGIFVAGMYWFFQRAFGPI